jgi:hypothetical protein
MMEGARTSETLVNFYQTTRRYNPQDSHLHETVSCISQEQRKVKPRTCNLAGKVILQNLVCIKGISSL